MKKIPTIFDRDWKGNRGVIDKLIVDYPSTAGMVKIKGKDFK